MSKIDYTTDRGVEIEPLINPRCYCEWDRSWVIDFGHSERTKSNLGHFAGVASQSFVRIPFKVDCGRSARPFERAGGLALFRN